MIWYATYLLYYVHTSCQIILVIQHEVFEEHRIQVSGGFVDCSYQQPMDMITQLCSIVIKSISISGGTKGGQREVKGRMEKEVETIRGRRGRDRGREK